MLRVKGCCTKFLKAWKEYHKEKKRRKQYVKFHLWVKADGPFEVHEVSPLVSGEMHCTFDSKEALDKWLGDERAAQAEYRRLVLGEFNSWD